MCASALWPSPRGSGQDATKGSLQSPGALAPSIADAVPYGTFVYGESSLPPYLLHHQIRRATCDLLFATCEVVLCPLTDAKVPDLTGQVPAWISFAVYLYRHLPSRSPGSPSLSIVVVVLWPQ
jgi:hypothetical protein